MQRSASVTPSPRALELASHLRRTDQHIQSVTFHRWPYGASSQELPDLQVLVAHSEDEGLSSYHYLTAGASDILDQPGYGLEFCFQSNVESDQHIELMVLVVYMHLDPSHRLGVGHTMNVGRPILAGSRLDRLLVSLPYPYGEDFEFVHFADGHHARLLWLMPICPSEERACHEEGLDSLEAKFEEAQVDFLDAFRDCVT
jgi:hypothetical protein